MRSASHSGSAVARIGFGITSEAMGEQCKWTRSEGAWFWHLTWPWPRKNVCWGHNRSTSRLALSVDTWMAAWNMHRLHQMYCDYLLHSLIVVMWSQTRTPVLPTTQPFKTLVSTIYVEMKFKLILAQILRIRLLPKSHQGPRYILNLHF